MNGDKQVRDTGIYSQLNKKQIYMDGKKQYANQEKGCMLGMSRIKLRHAICS